MIDPRVILFTLWFLVAAGGILVMLAAKPIARERRGRPTYRFDLYRRERDG